jgi:probable F420-dependent oxidoreductase
VKIGAIFPTTEIGTDPAAIRDWAQAAEGLGMSHAITYDHVLGAVHADREPKLWGPYTERDAFHEPFVLFAWLAAQTRRLELATGVLILPQRQTALVAKQAAEIDVLSGGRLRLGVGIGWVPDEFDALNERYENRGRRSEEQLAVLRTLWTEQPASFSGRWHHLDRAGIAPLPVQRPIPIWIGTHSEAGLRRVGQLADGWMPTRNPLKDTDRIRALRAQITAAAQDAGRDPALIGVDPQVVFGWVAEHEWGKYGAAWREHGATHITVTSMGLGTSSVDEHLAALRHVRDELAAAGVLTGT